jgi:type IV pilus assembly protein PilC
MPEYSYQGVDRGGKRVQGKVNAPNEGELRMILRGQGIRPVRIAKLSALQSDLGSLIKGSQASISLQTLVVFTRQLQVLISSGIPIVQGLEILAEQSTDKNMKGIMAAIKEKVSGGAYFWEALSSYPKAFPTLYVSLIKAGETSGAIDQMLKRLSRYLEDSDRLRKLLKGAMMYPIIVVTIGIAVIAAMMIFVIPKFEELLRSSGQELPGPTQFVIDLSNFMVNNIVYLMFGTGAAIFLILKFVQSPEGKAALDRLLFRAPLFGNLAQKGGAARFCRTMQTLLSSGVNLIDAVDICRATIGNAVLEEAVAKIRTEIESGKTLGMVVTQISIFPRMAAQMIAVGESTGNLDKMLEKVADFYEEEVEAIVGGMTKLIEPLVLVFLGGAVGGLLIAMYLPIFKMAGGQNE